MNSRTRSRVPTMVIGIDPKLEVSPKKEPGQEEERGKTRKEKKWILVYSKYYKDKVFMYNLEATLNTENVILANVDIKDALVVNFEKKIQMFPPIEMKFSISGFKVLDLIAIEQYFV